MSGSVPRGTELLQSTFEGIGSCGDLFRGLFVLLGLYY